MSPRQRVLLEGPLRLPQQHRLSRVIAPSRLVGSVAHRGESYPAVLREAADHVEDDADLPRLVEMETVPRHDVEEVRDHEPTKQPGLEMVGRDEVLLLRPWCEEQGGRRVITPVGEEL